MKHFYSFTNRVRKSFRGLVLAALVVFGTASAAAQETLNCPAGTVSGTTMTFNTDNFTVVHAKGTDTNFASYSPWRVYTDNTVTFTGGANVGTITSVVITATSDAYATAAANGTITPTGGGSVSGSASGSTVTFTVTGTVTSFTLKPTAQSRWSSIVINYTPAAPATPYTVYFYREGSSVSSVTQATGGAAVALPTDWADCSGYTFAGWSTTDNGTSAPTITGSTYTPTADISLYAVYSQTTGGGTATLTLNNTSNLGDSYASTAFTQDGIAFGRSNAAIMSSAIQIKAGTSNGIWNTGVLPGAITQVVVTGKTNSSTLKVGSTSKGTEGGTFSCSSTTTTKTFNASDNYKYFAIYATSKYTQINSIVVTYSSSTTTYTQRPGCCTAPTTALALTSSEGTSLILSGGDAETTIGAAATTGNDGTITYAITSGDENHALLDESTGYFTADATGTWTITATQALNGTTCGGTATITITVSEATSTITYNANGGTGTMTAQTGTTGAAVTLTNNSFTRTGYTFTGWNTASDGTGTVYTNVQATTYQTMTLYAQWSIISRTVTSNLTGCTATGIPANVNFETTAITATVTADCYTLPASISVTMGGNPLTLDTDYSWATSGANNLNIDPSSGFTGNIVITITATATPDRTVTFSTGLAGLDIAAASVACGSSTTLPTVNRDLLVCEQGKDFAGWSTNPAATSVEFAEGAAYTPTGDVTLYGVWSEGTVSNDYKKITTADDVTDGDYIVGYNFNSTTIAMTNTVYATGQLTATEVTPSSDIITTTDNSIIWKIQKSGGNYTIKNEAVNKYANISGSSLLLENTSSNYTLRVSSGKFYFTSSSYELLGYINASGNYFFAKSGTSSYNAYLFKRQSSVSYSSTPSCTLACADAAVVTLTPTPSSINMPASGNATTTIAFSQLGGGDGTWGTPSVTRLSGTGTATVTKNGTNIDFSTTGVGEYEVSIAYTETCAKVGKTTITVLATPVVTIVDVTPLTFTANCGESSVAKSVSVSGYNLTANMTATAPTNFLVSSDDETYGATATFGQAGGTASGTLYIKANPPAGSTNTISGNVSLTSTGATERTVAVSATVSCTPVTVTFLDWDGTSTVWNAYYAGSTQTLPAPTRDACAGWTFSGWTTNNLTAISAGDIVGTEGDNLTLTGSTTYYAVYTLEGSTGSTTDLIISEYVEGSSNNRYIEIYNGTGSSVNLSNYKLQLYANGKTSATEEAALSGTLANNTTIVYKNNQAALTLPDGVTAITHTALGFNGDDAIALYNTSTASYADIFGRIGNDPGTAWTGAGGYTTVDKTLVRKSNVTSGITTSPTGTGPSAFTTLTTEWDMYSIDVVANLGSHTFAGGSTSYTLSPACCDINLVKPTVTTSSADESVTVSWPSVKHEGVEAATAYELTYKLASSSADPTVVPVVATGAASYSQTITGLTNCSDYVFTVEAIGDPNAATTICSSPIATVTTKPGVAYTVNYQYGAGTGTPNVWVSGCSNGASTTLPAVTPNTLAYVFAGWYDGTTRVGGAGDSYEPTADVTLVAQYSAAPTYTLTFKNEGAEILTKTVYSTAAENDRKATEPNANYADYGLELTPLTTACSEAVFVGWTTTQTDALGTTTSPTLVTFPYTISDNATLFALWKITDTEGGGTATDFVKVTSTPSDWSGDYVIVSGTKAMKNTVSGGEMGASDVTISNNTISNPDASIIWTFAKTGTDTYSVYNEAVSSYAYITGDDSKKAGLSATTKDLTIGFNTAGDYDQIQIIGSTARCFSYYATTTVWRTYSTLTYSTGSLYRRVAGTTTYYSSPVCSPMITVDPADVLTCISADDLVVAVGGTATSTGHTVAARNCSGTSIVPVITGTGRTAFSIDWTSKPLENGRVDAVYTVSYNPLTGSSHEAQLQFKTDDGAVVSSTVNLCGTVCTSALFTTQSSTQSSITFAWSAPLSGASLRVWNDITGSPACGPQPYDQTVLLGTETFKTISGLSASTTFHYQITNGGCVSEVRNITTSAAVGLPVLTASPTLWETMAEANRASTYTNTTINLTGANMPNAIVSIALRGETAAFTLVPSATITLNNGAGSIGVTYNPVKPQTNIAYIDLTYDSDCETKTVTITLVGNVPGIDIVEVNPDASGFTLHTDLEGTPNIVLSQEVEHQGDGRQANDLFFSKYFEATQTLKLLGLYNGTNDTISLRGIRIGGHKAGNLPLPDKAALWNPTEIIALDTLQYIAPGKEIILFSATGTDATTVSCIAGSVGWEHEGWYPVSDKTAETVFNDAKRNLFINGKNGNTNASIQTGGDRVYGLQRKAVDGTWEFIDVIGALHSTAQGDSVIGRQVKASGALTGMDDPGWVCMDGTNYLTKEAAPLSTNRHLLIRKNTVVDGLNALEQNTEDFATLCTEWEGLFVPKGGVGDLTEQEITCLHFGQVSTFNYDGYYASFERIDDNLVTFTAATGRPGDWVGSFLNPTETFQDSLRCYNLKISVERYYDSRDVPPTERTKAYVQNLDPIDDAAEIAALDTVEVMSTQYKVPIIVKTNDSITTKDDRFIELSKDTCSTCDVVILNKGILTKSSDADDRDSVRTVYVYKGGRLVVPGNLNYAIQNLHIRAEGDSVGSAYIQGNLKMQQARIYHDKRIDNTKYYFFALPYSCAVSKITEMNGKTLGVYGTSWAIKYYDGLSRIENHGLESNWKLVAADATLEAGRGYVLAISSDIKKFVRFPLVTEATFTEKNTAKTLDVTQYGELQASSGALGYNNVGWNLVGNPYISYFTSATPSEPEELGIDGVNNGTVELGGYYQSGGSGWTRYDTNNIYVTVPNANNVGYTQARASETKLSPFISFFVQAQATGSLTFATTSRKQAPIVAAGVKSTTVDQTNTIALNLTVGAETDRTTFILNDDYITGYEIGSDLLKWKGTWAKLPYFYSFDEDNNPLAYNAVPYSEAKKQMPLGFYMPTKYAPYKFSIDRSRSDLTDLEHVYLLRKGSVVADLLLNDYSNTDIARMAENKEFAISIQRSATVITPVAETVTEGLVPYAWIKGHEMRIEQVPAEGQLVILDAVGRAIEVRTLTGNHVETFTLRSDGVYAVSITTPQNQYILKVVTQ